ncbi:MAG: hypothetical protein IJK77_02100 [Lachnospiraceae bacterium]|nr:hypothetical protein [Lachnospiraceae bacterium]
MQLPELSSEAPPAPSRGIPYAPLSFTAFLCGFLLFLNGLRAVTFLKLKKPGESGIRKADTLLEHCNEYEK